MWKSVFQKQVCFCFWHLYLGTAVLCQLLNLPLEIKMMEVVRRAFWNYPKHVLSILFLLSLSTIYSRIKTNKNTIILPKEENQWDTYEHIQKQPIIAIHGPWFLGDISNQKTHICYDKDPLRSMHFLSQCNLSLRYCHNFVSVTKGITLIWLLIWLVLTFLKEN